MDNKLIYLDNAATTKTYESVNEAILGAMNANYFNPSALYPRAVETAKLIKDVSDRIKKSLHAPDGDLYFTSGGTESNNTALFCTKKKKGGRIIVGAGEHDSVIAPANELKTQGYDVLFAPIKPDGTVDVEEFKKLLSPEVCLVSIMHASNETGGINDLQTLVGLVKRANKNAIFHSDGVQAFGKIPVNLAALGVDLYSITAHKIHGPKGIGALYVKKGVSLKPLLFGGGQQKGIRSGTENYPSIVGFDKAIECSLTDFSEKYSKIKHFREYLCKNLISKIEGVQVITPLDNSVPNILTVAFKDVRGEVLLHSLEAHNILVGIGSACSSHHESRFKSLLRLDDRHRDGIMRFSMSDENDPSDIERIVEAIKEETDKLRRFTRI